MKDEIILEYDKETGMWHEKPEPYMVVEIPTKADWEHLQEVFDFYHNHQDDMERILERLEESKAYSVSPQFSKGIDAAIEIIQKGDV